MYTLPQCYNLKSLRVISVQHKYKKPLKTYSTVANRCKLDMTGEILAVLMSENAFSNLP